VEFLTVGVLLLVPLVYLVLTLGRIQAATFAADGAARTAARAIATAPSEAEGRARAAVAVRLALTDQGFDAGAGGTGPVVECSTTPCLRPGGMVVARVAVQVVLPGVPAFVDRSMPLRITVRAAQAVSVDEFRASPRGALG
jgi:hypothetical protein